MEIYILTLIVVLIILIYFISTNNIIKGSILVGLLMNVITLGTSAFKEYKTEMDIKRKNNRKKGVRRDMLLNTLSNNTSSDDKIKEIENIYENLPIGDELFTSKKEKSAHTKENFGTRETYEMMVEQKDIVNSDMNRYDTETNGTIRQYRMGLYPHPFMKDKYSAQHYRGPIERYDRQTIYDDYVKTALSKIQEAQKRREIEQKQKEEQEIIEKSKEAKALESFSSNKGNRHMSEREEFNPSTGRYNSRYYGQMKDDLSKLSSTQSFSEDASSLENLNYLTNQFNMGPEYYSFNTENVLDELFKSSEPDLDSKLYRKNKHISKMNERAIYGAVTKPMCMFKEAIRKEAEEMEDLHWYENENYNDYNEGI
jgi:hypothetical protein